MNKNQRKRIEELQEALASLIEEVEDIATEERDKFENLPESLQQSERSQLIEAAADALDSVADNLREAIDGLSDIE